MARDSVSSIKALNAAIASHNPFDRLQAVREPEIWSQGLPDVAALNGHAAGAVFQAIERVRAGQAKVISMAITGTAGTGKSHLIHRIRHRLQVEGSGLLIYVSANHFNEVNLMRHEFQQILADSLRRSGSYGVMQCQQLATDVVNGAIKALTPEARGFAPLELVRKLTLSSQPRNLVLGGTEGDPPDVEGDVVGDEHHEGRDRAPGQGDPGDPAPRAHPVHDEVAGHLEQRVRQEEETGAQTERGRADAHVRLQVGLCQGDVGPVDVGHEVGEAEERQQPQQRLAGRGGVRTADGRNRHAGHSRKAGLGDGGSRAVDRSTGRSVFGARGQPAASCMTTKRCGGDSRAPRARPEMERTYTTHPVMVYEFTT